MAQYYNVVQNLNGTFTIENVSQLVSIDGQSVQCIQLLEGVNNSTNVVPQAIEYAATTDNNETTLYSSFNIGAHVATSQLEQR